MWKNLKIYYLRMKATKMKLLIKMFLIFSVLWSLQGYPCVLAEGVNSESVVKKDAAEAFELIKKGYGLYEENKYKEAVEILKTAALLDDQQERIGSIYGLIGLCYDKLEERRSATEYYYRALQNPPEKKYSPKLKEYYCNLYMCISRNYSMLKEHEKVIQYTSKFIELNPLEYADPYVLRASSYIDMKLYEKALEDLNKAVKISPENNKIRALRSMANMGVREKLA